MGNVQLKIPPFFAHMLSPDNTEWLILEKEIDGDTTLGDILADLASKSPVFRDRVFNPDAGTVGDQVDIVLNHNLLHFPRDFDAKLQNGDVIILLPVYTGG